LLQLSERVLRGRGVEQLRRDGRVDRGWLGVSVQDMVPEEARPTRRAVVVTDVVRGGPSQRGGLRARRLSRNVWKLSRAAEEGERGGFSEGFRRRL
jgi:S1-C subfamily serine protease